MTYAKAVEVSFLAPNAGRTELPKAPKHWGWGQMRQPYKVKKVESLFLHHAPGTRLQQGLLQKVSHQSIVLQRSTRQFLQRHEWHGLDRLSF
jgi:hypothetical protein